MNSKGSGIPSLAFVALIILVIILIAALFPPVKETILEFLNAIFGGGG
ncbi:MAG: hypothetical protein WBD09_02620 [Halobacteriota archaeon]